MNATETSALKSAQPAQSMRDFFAREDVQALQAVQKTSRYGSVQHRKAFESMKALALEVGAAQFFGEY